MAYISQENKKEILTKIKEILPKKWKISGSIKNSSRLVLTLTLPKLFFFEMNINPDNFPSYSRKYGQKNREKDLLFYTKEEIFELRNYDLGRLDNLIYYFNKEDTNIIKQIVEIANEKNYDNSDVMTDYFDIGYFFTLYVKPESKLIENEKFYGIQYFYDENFEKIISKKLTKEEYLDNFIVRNKNITHICL